MSDVLKPTLLVHKPPGVIWNTASQLITPASRASTDRASINPAQWPIQDLHCVTPLETGASGLIVFTFEWTVKRKLVTDAMDNEHEFLVDIAGTVPDEALQALQRPRVKVSRSKQSNTITGLRFALKHYEAGQIAAACARLGLQVVEMKRLRIGRMPMASLAEGQWRYLMGYERF